MAAARSLFQGFFRTGPYLFGVQITPVSAQRLRRLEEVSEAVVHATRAAARPTLDFLATHGKAVGHGLDLTESLTGADRGVAAGLGAANLVLGMVELSQSYQALCAGDRTVGFLNAAGGSSSLVAAAALLWAAGSGLPALGPLNLGNLGAASSGIGSLADGLEDLVLARRERAGPLALGLGGLKMAAGGMLLAGAMTSQGGLQAAGSLVFLGAAAGQHLRTAFTSG